MSGPPARNAEETSRYQGLGPLLAVLGAAFVATGIVVGHSIKAGFDQNARYREAMVVVDSAALARGYAGEDSVVDLNDRYAFLSAPESMGGLGLTVYRDQGRPARVYDSERERLNPTDIAATVREALSNQ